MESVRFIINDVVIYFEGDLENCMSLLSDDDFTLDYITRTLRINALADYGFDQNTNISDLNIVRSKDQPHAPSALKNVINQHKNIQESRDVWMPNSKPTELDNKATLLLLELRGTENYKKRFDDKKSTKNILWREIAQALNKAGYNVGEGRQGAEKCRQKWANLQKSYMTFITNVNSTGSSFKSEPPYYTEIDKILRDKDKVQPSHLKDSLPHSSLSETENQAFSSSSLLSQTEATPINDSQSCSSDTVFEYSSQPPEDLNALNSTATPQKRKRANTTKTEMVQLIEKIREDQKTFQSDILSVFKKSNEKQEQQRDTFISIISKLLRSPKKKKRKRKHSSSESDSTE